MFYYESLVKAKRKYYLEYIIDKKISCEYEKKCLHDVFQYAILLEVKNKAHMWFPNMVPL